MPKPVTLLVIANPAAQFLKMLAAVPDHVRIVVGDRKETFEETAPEADAVVNCFLANDVLQYVFERGKKLRWVHSLSAGLDNVLFPALIESKVPLTNGRGVFAQSLGEFSIASVLFFAKDLRRMLRNQAAGVWEQFDVETLPGKVMGIVGYGAIGQACASRAKAMGMRVAALRRRPELSKNDPLVDQAFGLDRMQELLTASDYVVVASALTPETRGMIGEAQLRAMRNTAVLINLGRGPVVVEAALIKALEENWIRGAALDVFDQEPLPAGHPFYRMENVLMSPHCADHTATWLDEAMQFFIRNFERFREGEPLENVVDKRAGY